MVPRKVPEGFRGPKRGRFQCAVFSDGAVAKTAKVAVFNEKQHPDLLEKFTVRRALPT